MESLLLIPRFAEAQALVGMADGSASDEEMDAVAGADGDSQAAAAGRGRGRGRGRGNGGTDGRAHVRRGGRG